MKAEADLIDGPRISCRPTFTLHSPFEQAMSRSLQEIQSDYLNTLRKERKRVAIYLVNGIKLTGHIQSFDTYLVYLNSTSGSQVLYKHAISTICEDHGPAGRPSNRGPSRDHASRPRQ